MNGVTQPSLPPSIFVMFGRYTLIVGWRGPPQAAAAGLAPGPAMSIPAMNSAASSRLNQRSVTRSVCAAQIAELAARLVRLHHQHVLEAAQVDRRRDDRAVVRRRFGRLDLRNRSDDQAFGVQRPQLVADPEPGGDHDVTFLDRLGLEQPVHDQRVPELAPDDPGGARALDQGGPDG